MQSMLFALALLFAVASAARTSYETVDTAVTYTDLPKTNFKCSDKPYIPGIYADEEAHCQVYHFCTPHYTYSFACGEGTAFNQKLLTCDYPQNFTCSETNKYFETTAGIGVETGAVSPSIPETGFSCATVPHPFGLYADVSTNCAVFHYCSNAEKSSFNCPAGTRFNQEKLICDYADNVFDCAKSADFFFVNENIGKSNVDVVHTVNTNSRRVHSHNTHATAHHNTHATAHHNTHATAHHNTHATSHHNTNVHHRAQTANLNANNNVATANVHRQNAAVVNTAVHAENVNEERSEEDNNVAHHGAVNAEVSSNFVAAAAPAVHTSSHHHTSHRVRSHSPSEHVNSPVTWVRPNDVNVARQGGASASAHSSSSHRVHHSSSHHTANQVAPVVVNEAVHHNSHNNDENTNEAVAVTGNQGAVHSRTHYTVNRVSTYVKPAVVVASNNVHSSSHTAARHHHHHHHSGNRAGNFVCPTFNHEFEGYFADVESGCKQYHRCLAGRLVATQSCGENAVFNQAKLACDYTANCAASPRFYEHQFVARETTN